jgi:CrcB protein
MLSATLWAAVGGAFGAMARLVIGTVLFAPGQFPWVTLAINIAGSFGIGLLWGLGHQQVWFDQWGRYLLVVGLLGGFTTFSAFSLETVGLIEGGRIGGALGYVFASVFGCVLAAWAGQRMTGYY